MEFKLFSTSEVVWLLIVFTIGNTFYPVLVKCDELASVDKFMDKTGDLLGIMVNCWIWIAQVSLLYVFRNRL
jgi:hypothetical protein